MYGSDVRNYKTKTAYITMETDILLEVDFRAIKSKFQLIYCSASFDLLLTSNLTLLWIDHIYYYSSVNELQNLDNAKRNIS